MQQISESAATALAHLEMIFQSAAGTYKPKAGELEKRRNAVVAFIRDGSCLADDQDRAVARAVRDAVLTMIENDASPRKETAESQLAIVV